MRLARFRLFALFAALSLLLAGTALGDSHYFCHMSGRVTAECCCASGDGSDDAPSAPKASPADCCVRLTPTPPPQANRETSPAAAVQPAALAATLVEPSYAFPRAPAPTFVLQQSRGPPLARPPLFLVHCALLT